MSERELVIYVKFLQEASQVFPKVKVKTSEGELAKGTSSLIKTLCYALSTLQCHQGSDKVR